MGEPAGETVPVEAHVGPGVGRQKKNRQQGKKPASFSYHELMMKDRRGHGKGKVGFAGDEESLKATGCRLQEGG